MNLLEKVLRGMSVEHLSFLSHAAKKALFEKSNRSEQIRAHWEDDNRGRGVWASPWAPSPGDVAVYEEWIKSLGRAPVRALVLGGTPALRQLLFSFSISAIVADQSLAMLERTSRILGENIFSKETLVRSDWLDLPFPDGFFDIIVGDLVFFQFLPKDQDSFLLKIKSLLSSRGAFITRVHCVSQDIYKKDISSSTRDIVSSGKDEKLMTGQLMAFLLDRCGSFEEGKTNRAAAIEELRKYAPKSEEEKRVIQETIHNWGGSFLDYALQQEKDVIKKFEPYFLKISIRNSQDYDGANQYPIIYASN